MISHSYPILLINRKIAIRRPPPNQVLKSNQYTLVNTLIRHDDDED